MPNVFGVLCIDFSRAYVAVLRERRAGRVAPVSMKSLRAITSEMPDGPRFFCAPA